MPLYSYVCEDCKYEQGELITFSVGEEDVIAKVCGTDTEDDGCGGNIHRVLRAPAKNSTWNGTGTYGVNGYFSKALGKHVANPQVAQKIMEDRGFVCEADLPADRWDSAVETQKERVSEQDKHINVYTDALKSGKTKEEAVVEAFPAHDALSGKLDKTFGSTK